MELNTVFNNLMLLGAVQGFIFSGIAFYSKKYNSRSNFFLGLLILTFSYNILQNYLVVSNIFSSDDYFSVFYIPFTSVFLVLFYLYVKLFLYPERKLTQGDKFLFLPFLITFAESFFEKIGFATGLFDNSDVIYFNYFRFVQETFNVGYSLVMIVLSYRFILKFEKQQQSTGLQFPKIRLKWLKIITLILLGLCMYWIVPLCFEFQYKIQKAISYFYVLWIGLTITIYALGHIGLYQFGIVQEQKNIHQFLSNRSPVIVETTFSKNEYLNKFEKFVKQDKNYLDSNLSLELVAEQFGVNKSHLSRIINTELGKNFSDYVNELRVEEAKSYMKMPEFQNYTLISIGLEAGFNSKTAFNSAFKKYTGITPSEFRKELK